MIIDFLKTKRTPDELRIALEILREFKTTHSGIEDLASPFLAWAKLEQLEEFLDHLVTGAKLESDTLEYIAVCEEAREQAKADPPVSVQVAVDQSPEAQAARLERRDKEMRQYLQEHHPEILERLAQQKKERP